MNNDLINELYSKIDNQEKIIVDLQKNNSGITLEEHVRVLNAYQELEQQCKKQKEVIDKAIEYINSNPNVFYDEYLIDVETLKNNEMKDEFVGEIRFISNLLDILNEVSE